MTLTVRDVIRRAGRLQGQWDSGSDPEADQVADALDSFNALKRSMFGTVIGPRLGPRDLGVATFAQAENGGEYQIPAAVGGFVLRAPANPKAGARFGVVDTAAGWTTMPLTIMGNGRLIALSAANYVINTTGANTRFWFRADVGSWLIEQDWAELDEIIEFPDVLIAYLPYMLAVAMASEYGQDLRPEVSGIAGEGRAAFARTYARRGRNQLDAPIGATLAGAGDQAAQGQRP
jgi:hypothetical protein